jgi:hypothetical protein
MKNQVSESFMLSKLRIWDAELDKIDSSTKVLVEI